MIVVYHPGYMPRKTTPVAPNVFAILNGPPADCEECVSRWTHLEEDFWVFGRFDSREDAKRFVAEQNLVSLGGNQL